MSNNSTIRIQEAADYLGVSTKTLRRWETSGKLSPAVRTSGNQRLYTLSQLDSFKVYNTARQRLAEKQGVALPNPLPFSPSAKVKDIYPVYSRPKPTNYILVGFIITILLGSLLTVLTRLNLVNNTIHLRGEGSPTSEVFSPSDSKQVLAEITSVEPFYFQVSVPSLFKDTATFEKDIVAPNLIYSLTAGDGISLSGEQDLTISSDAEAWKSFKVGSTTLSAVGTSDTFEYAGSGSVSLALDTTNKKLTITGSSDASTLDSIDSSSFLRSDASDSYTSGTLTFSDGTFLDLSAILHDDTALQGLRLPQSTSLTAPTSGEGFIAYNTSDNQLYIYNGTSWSASGYWALSGSNLYTTSTSYNVGIGTTAPSYNLGVTGNVGIGTSLYLPSLTSGSILFINGSAGLVDQDNTKLFWDNSQNRLGIGTSAPSYATDIVGTVQITGSGFTGLRLPTGATENYVLTTDGSGNASWTNTSGGGSFGAWTLTGSTIYPNATTYNLVLGSTSVLDSVAKLVNTGSSLYKPLEVVDLPSGGNVGTAAATVDIYTSFNVTQTTTGQTITLPDPTSPIAGRLVYISNTGSVPFTFLSSTVTANTTTQAMWNGTAWTLAGSNAGLPVGTANNTTMRWNSATSTWQENTYLITTSTGLMGIGTTAPQAKLGIVGGVGIGTTDSFANAAIAASNLAVQGSVGIGTTSPYSSTSTLGVVGGIAIGTTATYSNKQTPTGGLIVEGNVGMGTTSPTQKLTVVGDIASQIATGVEGLKLTDTSDVTKMAMKWGSATVNLDLPSASSVNKFSNSGFETDLTGWSGNSLDDQFTTDRAAGAVNGTSAEPTGGTRTVVDTNSKLSITNSQLSFATGGSTAGNPGIWWPVNTRTAGKIITGSISTSGNGYFGWDNNQTGGLGAGAFRLQGTNLRVINSDGASITVGDYAYSTTYQLAIILQTTGNYYFVKGGAFTNWTLVYDEPTGTGNVYPSLTVSETTDVITADNIRIPTSTWLPTPLAYDTFTRADGAIGSSETTGPDSQTTPSLAWTGSTATISSNKAIITPTLGGDVITNGGFDSDTSWTKDTGWSISGGVAVADATSNGSVRQAVLTPGVWYQATWDLVSRTSGNFRHYIGSSYNSGKTVVGTYTGTDRALTSNTAGGIYTSTGVGSIDNVIIKPLTLSELFATVSTSDKDVVASTDIVFNGDYQAGIVTNLDSASSPTAGLVAYLDSVSGTNTVLLDKFTTATTWTNLTSGGVTYVSGATLRVITYHSDASTLKVRVYYNNALVGTEQTVTDAGIISNTLHGLFSTYSGNTFDNFTLFARGSDGEYDATIPAVDLTATRDTSVHYAGSASLKLVAGTNDNAYTQSVTLPDTSTYNLTAYVYTTGAAVTTADLDLYYDTAELTTTFTSVGNGWYKLSGSLTGVASAKNYGVKVHAGKTVYVDSLALFTTSGSSTTLNIANSLTGLGGMSVESTTTLNSGLAGLQALIVKGFTGQTANLLQLQNSAGTVLSAFDASGYLGIGTTSPLSSLDVRSGNVGIGTTMAATQKLDIQGGMRLTGAFYDSLNAAGSSGYVLGSTGTGTTWVSVSNLPVANADTVDLYHVNSGTTNYLVKYASATALGQSVLFDDGTNMGIGTTAPTRNLDILNTSNPQLRLTHTAGTYYTDFQTTSAGNLYINPSGALVGIGTSSPGATLHLLDTTEQLRLGYDASNYLSFTVDSAGNLTLADTGTNIATFGETQASFEVPAVFNTAGDVSITYDIVLTNQTSGGIYSYGPMIVESGESFENNNLSLKTYGTGDLVADVGGNLIIQSADPALIFDVSTATDTDFWLGITEDAGADDDDLFQIGEGVGIGTSAYMTINTSGNVGVGTSVPTKGVLNVLGSMAIGSTAYTEVSGAAPSNGLIIEGNVGFGTTSPSAMLSVGSSTPLTINSAGSMTAANTILISAQNAIKLTHSAPIIYTESGNMTLRSYSNDIIFQAGSSGSERMRLTSSGYLGIGTTSPGKALGVVGGVGIGTTDSFANAAIAANNLAVQGSIGIGVTNPLQKLHVEGQCVAAGTLIKRRKKKKGRFTDEWEDVPVEDIKPGDEVLTLNEGSGEWEWQKVEKLMDMHTQEVSRIVTTSGLSIKTTANHPYLTLTSAAPVKTNRLSNFEIDQSGRIETLTKDTILGIANAETSFVTKLDRKQKKIIYNQYQKAKKTKLFGPEIFSALLIASLEKAELPVANLTIDIEYPGYEKMMRAKIHARFPKINITFKSIGKSSPAHQAAYAVTRSKKEKTGASSKLKGFLAAELLHFGLTKIRSSRGLQLRDNYKTNWTKVKHLKPGLTIATLNGWEKIAAIYSAGKQQTYDLQIANTHNFVANGIIAHNTYINGDLGIGTTSPTMDLDIVNGAAYARMNAGDAGWTTSSSREIKENFLQIDATGILDRISAIPVYTFDFINGPKDRMGLVAEDFYGVFGRGRNTEINYQEVSMAMWLGIKELTKQIQELQMELGISLDANHLPGEGSPTWEVDQASLTDLTVAGLSTLGDVTITGNIAASDLTIDSLNLSINALGNIKFMNGAIVMDTKGNLDLKEGVILGNSSFRGQEDVNTDTDTIRIDRTWDTPPTSVTVTPTWNTNAWVENISEAGFDIKVASSPGTISKIFWIGIW